MACDVDVDPLQDASLLQAKSEEEFLHVAHERSIALPSNKEILTSNIPKEGSESTPYPSSSVCNTSKIDVDIDPLQEPTLLQTNLKEESLRVAHEKSTPLPSNEETTTPEEGSESTQNSVSSMCSIPKIEVNVDPLQDPAWVQTNLKVESLCVAHERSITLPSNQEILTSTTLNEGSESTLNSVPSMCSTPKVGVNVHALQDTALAQTNLKEESLCVAHNTCTQ